MKSYYDELVEGTKMWPPLNLWSLLGIAQHYGIPTRLMDWSRRAMIAAYFAASDAVAKLHAIQDDQERGTKSRSKKLCVWAFAFDRYARFYNPDEATFFQRKIPPPAPVVKVTAPHAHNQNLHAQDGLFSLPMQSMKGRMHEEVDRTSLEAFIARTLVEDGFRDYSGKLFYRVRLNWSEAAHLMWRLRQEGLSKATIYPGFGGVVEALKEEHVLG